MGKKGLDKMLYDTNNVDINRLKECKSNLSNEANNFRNKTYNTFELSYLNSSSNIYVKNMVMTLEKLYKSIDKEYTDIINYLSSYIDNIVSLESVLSNNSTTNLIPDSTLRNYVDSKISTLPKERFMLK